MSIFRTIAAATLLSLSAVSTTGCSATDAAEHAEQTGGIELVASTASALTADAVARVDVFVFGPYESPAPQPRIFPLFRGGPGWAGRIGDLPPGTYRFDAQSFDANGTTMFRGQADGIVVQPTVDTFVNLNLRQMTSDPPLQNSAPFIDLLTASKRSVAAGETISLRTSATDADGDLLTYQWSASRGSIVTTNGAATQWIAPMDAGPVELTVAVDDHRGAVSIGRLPTEVGLARGAVVVNAIFIEAPRVTMMTVTNGQPRQGEVIRIDSFIEMRPSCVGVGGGGGGGYGGGYGYGYDPTCYGPGLTSIWVTDCGNTVSGATVVGYAGGPTSTELTVSSTAPECTVRLDIFDPLSGAVNSGLLTIHPSGPAVAYDVQ